MKHCLVFASLISPSKMILFEKKYQTFDTVFHHQMKHLEVRQKYSAARRIFNSLLGVSSGDETLHLMFDILRQTSCDRPPTESIKNGRSYSWSSLRMGSYGMNLMFKQRIEGNQAPCHID